jgi:serine/threonine protein kinase
MPSYTRVSRTVFQATCHLTSRTVGREAATGRQIAIKKIKVGQMKEGLDQSAIREVRYLRELKHPNVIEVRPFC